MLISANGRDLPAEPGDTILSALRRAERGVMHVCGGRGMCGTCRVLVDAGWWERLAPPSFNETRLLRVLRGAGPHHRLACQTTLSEAHDGLAITLDSPLNHRRLVKEEKNP